MLATSNKPVIVFLHGAGLAGYIWDDLIRLLPFDTLAIDFPHRGSAEKIPTKNRHNERAYLASISHFQQF